MEVFFIREEGETKAIARKSILNLIEKGREEKRENPLAPLREFDCFEYPLASYFIAGSAQEGQPRKELVNSSPDSAPAAKALERLRALPIRIVFPR